MHYKWKTAKLQQHIWRLAVFSSSKVCIIKDYSYLYDSFCYPWKANGTGSRTLFAVRRSPRKTVCWYFVSGLNEVWEYLGSRVFHLTSYSILRSDGGWIRYGYSVENPLFHLMRKVQDRCCGLPGCVALPYLPATCWPSMRLLNRIPRAWGSGLKPIGSRKVRWRWWNWNAGYRTKAAHRWILLFEYRKLFS